MEVAFFMIYELSLKQKLVISYLEIAGKFFC